MPWKAWTFRSRCRAGGVTLVEMAIVVALLGIVVAVAIPRYGLSLDRYRADAAARRVAADLNLAATRARALSASQTVTFQPAEDRYEIVGMKHLDYSAAPYVVELGGSFYRARLISATCGSDSNIIFNGHGVPDSDGTIVVQVGAVQRVILIDTDSGMAHVQ